METMFYFLMICGYIIGGFFLWLYYSDSNGKYDITLKHLPLFILFEPLILSILIVRYIIWMINELTYFIMHIFD